MSRNWEQINYRALKGLLYASEKGRLDLDRFRDWQSVPVLDRIWVDLASLIGVKLLLIVAMLYGCLVIVKCLLTQQFYGILASILRCNLLLHRAAGADNSPNKVSQGTSRWTCFLFQSLNGAMGQAVQECGLVDMVLALMMSFVWFSVFGLGWEDWIRQSE